jgi:hypothetical protein
MLVDGRLITVLGLNDERLLLGKATYLSEVFGITLTSTRYARLGKLFMLALTSGDMRRLLLARSPSYELRELQGIQTSSPTEHPEGKTDRSVMKLVGREETPTGYHLVYRADFRDDTWADVVKLWLSKWGGISR